MSASQQPSILFINRVFPPDKGATGLRLYELADFMAHKGWRVTVLCAYGRGGEPEHLHDNITVRRIRWGKAQPLPFSYYPWIVICLFPRAIFIRKHDLTVTMTDPPMVAVLGPLLKIFKKTRLVHWSQDVYPDILPVLGIGLPQALMKLLKRIMDGALKRYDCVVAIGRDMGQTLHKKGVEKEKLFIINNWPDRFFMHYDNKDGENPFSHPEVMTFLYSGNFGLAHDFDVILDGIKLLEQKNEPFRFVFSGAGRRYEELQEDVTNRGLKSVQFLAFQPEDRVRDLLSAGDVHLANMKDECLGLLMPSKVNSAFAFHKPIIFVGPVNSEAGLLIKEFEAGFVVDPSDSNARFSFARAVTDLGLHKKIWMDAARGSVKCAKALAIENTGGDFEKLALYLVSQKKK